MRVEILTMWYNEEFLAPFFLRHYSWADKINILFDEETTDSTKEIIQEYKNTEIIPFRFTAKYDDKERTDIQNKFYKTLDAPHILIVDADEFVFYKDEEGNFVYDLKDWLARRPGYDVYISDLYQVYRHRTDADLDPSREAMPQRRHGDPNITEGVNSLYRKPILARNKMPLQWSLGNHYVSSPTQTPINTCPDHLLGAHWANADPKFVFERRLKNRKERFSKRNFEKMWGRQNITATEESIKNELSAHIDDPQVF